MRLSTLAILATLSAGCASQPESPPAPTTSPAAPAATASQAVTAAATPASTTAEPQLTAPQGYKLVKRDGATLFCQKITEIGSRFPKEICVTPEAYADMERRTESDRQNFRKNSTLCGTGGCGGP